MKKIIIFLFFVCNTLQAQVTQEWVATYSGTGTGGNYADRCAVDKFGNFIVGGRSDSAGNTDYIILKYSSFGNLVWTRRYDGALHDLDITRDMKLDDSGNVYITGFSWEGTPLGGQNWVTIKYSSNGDFRWKQTLDWSGHIDQPFSLTLDNQRNVYVAGEGFTGPQNYNDDIILAKYSNNGEVIWIRSYGNSTQLPDWGYSVVTDDSDNVYVSGYSPSIITIKYDSAGNQKWISLFPRLSGEYTVYLYSKIDRQNNIIVNGRYDTYSNNITLKYDCNGNLLWSSPFYGQGGVLNVVNAIYIDSSSNIYLAGRTQTISNWHDALTVKYAPNGDTLWVRYYDDGIGQHDEARDITGDQNGNVYLTGYTWRDSDDYLTLKYNSNGNLIFSKKYSLSGNNASKGISIDQYNNIFITGSRDVTQSLSTIITIKYSQPTSVHSLNNFNSKSFTLNQNFPNPFNSETIINYHCPENSNIKIKIYDILGRGICKLVDMKHDAGNYEIKFDASNYPGGIYFYSLFVNNKLVETKRMLFLK